MSNILYITSKNIHEISDVEKLVNLEELYCENNEITTISKELVNLKELYCQFNQLTSLPDNLYNLRILYCCMLS